MISYSYKNAPSRQGPEIFPDLFRKGTIILLMTHFLVSQISAQAYNYQNYDVEDGLAQSFVYSITQDVQGYLWIGTGKGLSRYNGFIFENYATSDSLADNLISCSINDGEGMWFGHMNGKFSFYNGKTFRAFDAPQQNSGPVTDFTRSPDGQLWASNYSNGLMKLEKSEGAVNVFSFRDQILITSVEFLSENELLVGTNTGLLHCRLQASNEIEIIQPVEEIPRSKIACIQHKNNDTGFYVATENEGIFTLILENTTIRTNKIHGQQHFDLTGVQDVYEDSRSNLWIGSFGKGLVRMTLSSSGELIKADSFNLSNGYPTNNVKKVYEDREGIIWAGNYGEGLTQITPRTFFQIPLGDASYGSSVFSICNTGQYCWIGTERGLIKMHRPSGKAVGYYGGSSGLPNDTITSIFAVNEEELWIGTDKNGVFRMQMRNDHIDKVELASGVLENSITAINGNSNAIWIGTKKGLCRYDLLTGSTKWFSINQGGLPHNNINSLYEDNQKQIWVSSQSNVLAFFENDTVHKIPVQPVNGILKLGQVTEDKNATIWAGSNGSGVFIFGSDSVFNLTTKEGLLSDYCYSIICDADNNIWIGHKGGLSKVRKSDYTVKPISHFNNIKEGIGFNENAVSMDEQNNIYFGTDQGLLCYDPSLDNPLYAPPLLRITSIQVNNETAETNTGKMTLSPGRYKIRIEFQGISLRDPELVRYQYKLEGYDDWSGITPNTSVTYNQLTKGQYTFILKSSNGEGIAVETPVTIDIIIKKPVWEQWWFYIAVVSLTLMLIFIYIKRREYKLLAEKRILEDKVRERTIEIQHQKNEIAMQRDMIESKNKNITSSITYASNIQKAIFPHDELMNKLLPDYFILFNPKDIVSGDFYWLTRKNDKIVFALGDCTGHGVPGAFMSLLGITFLNEIVNIEGNTGSDAILTMLDQRVSMSLQKDKEQVIAGDGIDIAICVWHLENNAIHYTGEMNDLVYIRDNNLHVVQADRLSVNSLKKNPGRYRITEIDVKEGDVFYLFSDGYQDQFGGDRDKKFSKGQFYDTLLEIHALPMARQKEILDERIREWMKNTFQTDDISVMGIRM